MKSRKPRVLSVIGTRPEAIKMAPVISLLSNDERFESYAVSTGQHREMLSSVVERFDISLDADLELMRAGQSLNSFISRALQGIDLVYRDLRPDLVLIQGDTSSAMAAALAAFNHGARVAHLEAGLRTGNLRSPFPEEANRKIITQVADLHLVPTRKSFGNLLAEGVDSSRIAITGNTVIDALQLAADWDVPFDDPRLEKALRDDRKLVIVTTHRRENLKFVENFGRAINASARRNADAIFILPLHPNPRIEQLMLPFVQGLENVVVTHPLPYEQFVRLMKASHLIVSDSGGIQEEAPALGKPVLIMRDSTERPEAVESGANRLVGVRSEAIEREVNYLLTDGAAYKHMATAINPYGDGKAAERVVSAIAQLFNVGSRLSDFNPERP